MERLERRCRCRSAGRALRRLAGRCRPAHDRALRHAPRRPAPRRVAEPTGSGSRRVALIAIVRRRARERIVLLLDAGFELALLGRAVVGIGSGAAFVAGLDLVRAGGGGAGAAGPLRWRDDGRRRARADDRAAAHRRDELARAVLDGGRCSPSSPRLPTLAARPSPHRARRRAGCFATASCFRSGAPGGDVRPRGRRRQLGRDTARTPGRELDRRRARRRSRSCSSASSRDRPGGILARLACAVGCSSRPALVGSLGAARSCSRSAARFGVSALGALVLGLAAGLPFAVIFAAAQRLRPDAPGAAIALVNACAVLTILVGTPLAGLAFALPGDGRIAFAVIAALWAAALLAAAPTPIGWRVRWRSGPDPR